MLNMAFVFHPMPPIVLVTAGSGLPRPSLLGVHLLFLGHLQHRPYPLLLLSHSSLDWPLCFLNWICSYWGEQDPTRERREAKGPYPRKAHATVAPARALRVCFCKCHMRNCVDTGKWQAEGWRKGASIPTEHSTPSGAHCTFSPDPRS